METIQLFNWLKMPHEFNGIESTLLIGGPYDGCGNDTYHRWYPDRINRPVGKYEFFKTKEELAAAKELNQWLLDNGMVMQEIFLGQLKMNYFYVLIHVSW